MNNKILENLERLKKMLVLLSEDRKVVSVSYTHLRAHET